MGISASNLAVHGANQLLSPYKLEAKRASRDRGIPLSQCLDEIALREGYRNWSLLHKDLPRLAREHQAQLDALLSAALRDFPFVDEVGTLRSHIEPEGPCLKHTILGGMFVFPNDLRNIQRRHERLALFKAMHAGAPIMPYLAYEKIKKAGRGKLGAKQVDECLTGLVQIAISYFARSAIAKINGDKRVEEHPGLWGFTAHLLRSDPWPECDPNPAAKQALQRLTRLLPLGVPSRVIQSYWS